MTRFGQALLVMVLLAGLPARADDEEIDVTPAIAAAERWLALIDEGRIGASWEEAAPIFQEAMSRHRWETTLPGVRDPLGMPVTRKMRQADVARSMPNAPAGQYVVIYFDTRFQNRPLSTEIVTPMKVGDRWLIAGYIIR